MNGLKKSIKLQGRFLFFRLRKTSRGRRVSRPHRRFGVAMSATSAPRSRRPTQAFTPNESAPVPRDASLLHRSTKPAAPSKRLVHFRAFGQQLHAWLVQRVHASTLCTWRILFAICMYRQALNFGDMFDEFQRSVAVFPYPALGWVTPVEPAVGNALLAINRWAAVLVGLGLLTRPSSVVLFATFTYLFLLCQSNHNNHYILICHASRTRTLTLTLTQP